MILILLLTVALTACHHENVTSNWVYTPSTPVACNEPLGQIVLEGNYQGKNIYVQNPFANCTDTTIKFCTASVTINDSIALPKDSIASSAFRIPLTEYGLNEGDKIQIVIKHYVECKPKVLNPEVH